MSDYPRRRRLEPEPPKRGGIPIVPLMILVVLCGLALGGLLTKFFGAGAVQTPTPAPSFTPLPEATATFTVAATPAPVSTPSTRPTRAQKTAAPLPSVTLIPGTTPAPSSKPRATPKPRPKATQVVIVLTPTPAPTRAPVASATATPPPVVAAPTATPVLITGVNNSEHAASIVSAYIAALARGDSSTAAGYLAGGLPTETFINPNVTVNVSDMRTARNNDGSYNVTAQIVTSKGTYFASFVLRMGAYGMQITQHSATHI
ncbi:MAG TPA: hypothetical protein VMB20_12880 [Candidatus Acidoferrum sp.]|nr:hypothetical protein [Candidatus Acidoferrum sp.]